MRIFKQLHVNFFRRSCQSMYETEPTFLERAAVETKQKLVTKQLTTLG